MDNALIISSATHAGQLARLPHSDVGGHASLPRCCTMHHFGVCFWLFLLWCVLFCSVLLCSVLFVLSFRSCSWSRSRSCPGFVLFCFLVSTQNDQNKHSIFRPRVSPTTPLAAHFSGVSGAPVFGPLWHSFACFSGVSGAPAFGIIIFIFWCVWGSKVWPALA